MTVKKSPICVAVGSKSRSINAEVYGPLALHRTEDNTGWAITHLRTGMKIMSGYENKAVMLKVVDCLITDGVDWSWGTFGKGVRLTDIPESVHQARREAAKILYPEYPEEED